MIFYSTLIYETRYTFLFLCSSYLLSNLFRMKKEKKNFSLDKDFDCFYLRLEREEEAIIVCGKLQLSAIVIVPSPGSIINLDWTTHNQLQLGLIIIREKKLP